MTTGMPEGIPDGVRRDIEAHQQTGEVLICYAQMAFSVVFLFFYFVLPAPQDAPITSIAGITDSMKLEMYVFVNAIPLLLVGYFIFSVLRWWALRQGRASKVLPTLSVVVDVVLLLAVLYSLPAKYNGTYDIVLKAPTALYLFIFISLRMLRFEPSYVVGIGLLFAIGWTAMTIFVLGMPGVERVSEFLHYFRQGQTATGETIGHVLVGAEVDKIIVIVSVTAVLAVAQTRARQTLVRAVEESQASAALSRFFPPAVARKIRRSADMLQPGRGRVRNAAILNLDLRGFTPMARDMDPNDAMALLVEYQARTVPVIQKHGGVVDKFLGDGILATFGAAAESETFAADALRAVEEIFDSVKQWNRERVADGLEPLRVGAAVACGQVLFGTVGEPQRLEYTVIGPPVNLCAKLEKHTKVESVAALATLEAYDTAREQGLHHDGLEVRSQRAVAGLENAVDLVVLSAA